MNNRVTRKIKEKMSYFRNNNLSTGSSMGSCQRKKRKEKNKVTSAESGYHPLV